jgi:cell division protein FtsI (penicillin-binding protein 3)
MAFVLSLFAGRLVQMEGFDSSSYKTAALNRQLSVEPIPVLRGDITSSDGQVLAMTVQTYTVFADPQEIPAAQRAAVAAKLAGPLGVPAATVVGMLANPSSPEYQVLGTNIPLAAGTRIQAMDEPGIDMSATFSTAYPNAGLASDVVGLTNYTGTDGSLKGAAGLEFEYNSLLAGRPGSEAVERGVDGEPIPLTEVKMRDPVPAKSLRLTINSDIQYEADQVCQQRVKLDHARNCSIVVMTKTGQVLAMSQWPTYNPSDLTASSQTANFAVANVFAPGSTLKPVTVAAALEKGGQTPMSAYTIPSTIRVDHGLYGFQDAEPHPTQHYTIAGILAYSSNVGMVQVVQHITDQQQYDYLRAFGIGSVSRLGVPALGSTSGTALQGESQGLLPAPGSAGYWADDPYEYSFGQGLSVTAIQMASVYATIANNGVRVTPTIIAGTTSASGQFTPAPAPSSRRVIQAGTAHQLMTILQQVPGVDEQAGEPWGLLQGYTVASKTGTAQVSDSSLSNCLCQYGSSYIGIAPADNPQLIVAVNIQDPRGKYYGDEVAGPAFFDVMKFALQTRKIAPDYARTPYIRLTAP